MRVLTALPVLLAAVLVAAPASADTLQMQTPWVAMYEPGVPADECRSPYFHCTESASGDWNATCADGYDFALAPGAQTTPSFTIPDAGNGDPIIVDYPYWWSGPQLFITITYSASDPPTATDPAGVPVPPYPHLWGAPQDYLCTSSAGQRAAGSGVANATGVSVRRLVRTVHVPRTGRPAAARLACPTGHRLFRSGSAVGTYRAKRPTRKDLRQLGLRHREHRRSAAVSATATRKLDHDHRVVAQLWVDCTTTGA